MAKDGHDVSIADKVKSRVHPDRSVICDVRDPEAVKRAIAGRDVIYNLAAEHADDVRPISLYDKVNVDGARVVCKAATEAGILRIIFTSSVAIYGFATEELHEGSPARPLYSVLTALAKMIAPLLRNCSTSTWSRAGKSMS